VIAWACAIALTTVMLAMLFSLYRLLAGPATTDRILALDTLVINAIAAVVLMGIVWNTTMYFEVAVLFAMVAFLSTIALCKYVMHGDIIE
jgi:multicomponent K+:H+ antiporter subunit F